MTGIQGVKVSEFLEGVVIFAAIAAVIELLFQNLGVIIFALGYTTVFLGIVFGIYLIWEILKPVPGKKKNEA